MEGGLLRTLVILSTVIAIARCQIEDRCVDVKCPEDDNQCPDDSYKLPSLVPANECCSIPQGCKCLPCTILDCPKGAHVIVEQEAGNKPGSCCPVYKCVNDSNSCSFREHNYENGDTWKGNKCETCRCSDGLIFCQSVTCDPPVNCGRIAAPEGECCPICIGCMTRSGNFYNNSETWKEDDCTSCLCEDGQIHCHAEMCHIACVNPVHIPGQCCHVCPDPTVITIPPECPSVDNCTIHCAAGLRKDDYGCYECKCKLEDCNLNCPNGYVQDTDGQEFCECASEDDDGEKKCQQLTDCKRDCSHGFKVDKSGCAICKCNRCKKQRECHLSCPFGFQTNDRDCPICKCKEFSETSSVSAISSTDSSNHTTISPTTTTTTSVTSLHVPEGNPCFSSEGKEYDEGQAWHDGCRSCYCHDGQEMCALITCPVPACKHPLVATGECCPKCLDDTSVAPTMTVCQAIDGHHYVEGETWNMDSCSRCICHESKVLCSTQQCLPTPCPSPVKKQGECCASCSGFLLESTHFETNTVKLPCYSDDGRTAYQHGNSWRASVCQSCVCQHGKIKCFSDSCIKPTCARPVLRKNQCCPVCLDKKLPSLWCESEDRIYNNGEKWNPSECMQCMCLSGRIKCTEKQCSVACENPVHVSGQCCPVCTGKETKRLDGFSTSKFDKSIPIFNHPEYNDQFIPRSQDDTYKVHTNPESHLSSLSTIVFIVSIVLLVFIILGLIILTCRQRSQLRSKEQELKVALYKPRPKSTNLEFQGSVGPFFPSNGYLEKNKCIGGDSNDYTKPLMGPVNTYVAPVKNV